MQLANVLQVETEQVKQAVSLYCRLGFARKIDAESEIIKSRRHPSWNNLQSQTARFDEYFKNFLIEFNNNYI